MQQCKLVVARKAMLIEKIGQKDNISAQFLCFAFRSIISEIFIKPKCLIWSNEKKSRPLVAPNR